VTKMWLNITLCQKNQGRTIDDVISLAHKRHEY